MPTFGFYLLQPDGSYKYTEIEASSYEEAARKAREIEDRNLADFYRAVGSPTVAFTTTSIVAPGAVLDYEGNIKYGVLDVQNSQYIVNAIEGFKQLLQTTPEPQKYIPSPPQVQPTQQDVQTFTQKVEDVASVVQAVQALLQPEQPTPQPQPGQAQQANVKPTQPPTPSTPKSTLVTFPTPTQIVEAGVGAGIVLLLLLLLFMK